MASSARIDELRKKFDENPRRYFAPLANEYRKAGDQEQAIFICQEYLPQQPGHMSGHIVYGQALFELSRHEEAKAVFETALSLDPENLIALRHLGDIARHAGNGGEARMWYQRVLEADPRNEEIGQLMLTLLDEPSSAPDAAADQLLDASTAAPRPGTPTATTVIDMPAVRIPVEPAEPAAVSMDSGFSIEKSHDETDLEPADELLDLDEVTADGLPSSSALEGGAGIPASPPVPEPPAFPPAPRSADAGGDDLLDDAGGFDLGQEEGPFEADPFAIAASNVDASAEVSETTTVLPESAEEPRIEAASDLLLGIADVPAPDPAGPNIPPPDVAPPSGLEVFDRGMPQEAPAVDAMALESFYEYENAEPASAPPADAFITETMAELYLQQGHVESALDIYEKLSERRPDDAGLRGRADALRRRLFGPPPAAAGEAGPTIREFLGDLFAGRHATSHATAIDDTPPFAAEEEPPQRAAGNPSETVRGSLDVLFSGAEENASPGDDASGVDSAPVGAGDSDEALQGRPAHRAQSELSLDHVFKSNPAMRDESSAGGFSFDQFFAEGATPAVSQPVSDAPAEPSPDDVEQFNEWLNGLKKP